MVFNTPDVKKGQVTPISFGFYAKVDFRLTSDQDPEEIPDNNSKHIANAIEQEAGGILTVSSPVDIIRNREQVYNAFRDVEGRKKVGTLARHADQICQTHESDAA